MTVEKATQFVSKLLNDTKKNEIKWQRGGSASAALDQQFTASIADVGTVVVYKDMYDNIFLSFSYDPALSSADIDFEDTNFISALVRLYNYVYSLFPNPESVIDNYLKT